MAFVTLQDAKNRLTELAHDVERGEIITVTQNGRPLFDLVPHQVKKGIRLDAMAEFSKEFGRPIVTYIADDFDAPLPDDILLRPFYPSS